MLSLQMKSGDYLTINDNIVVQVFRDGSQIQVSIQAPREIPVVRGKVLERQGHQRPEVIANRRRKSPSGRLHARRMEQPAGRQEADGDGG